MFHQVVWINFYANTNVLIFVVFKLKWMLVQINYSIQSVIVSLLISSILIQRGIFKYIYSLKTMGQMATEQCMFKAIQIG